MHNFSRRQFLGSAMSLAGARALPVLAGLGAAANAAAGNDYKALVCVFLNGGNDAHNTVLATDTAAWQQYQRYRSGGGSPIALDRGSLLPITPARPQGRTFALHPALGPLRTLFEAGRAAVISNVGPLVRPTTLAEFKNGTAQLPRELFSHNDQQSVWQSTMPEGAPHGWGGRLADLVASGNSNNTFTCISTAENAVFVSGKTISQYQLSPNGVPAVRPLSTTLYGALRHPLASVITPGSNNLIEKEYAATTRRAIESQTFLSNALAASGAASVPEPSLYLSPTTNLLTANPLAQQLQTVARVIASRGALGVRRQVFFVSLGGFDTHANSGARHADLMAKLAHALAYFDGVTGNLLGTNMRQQVTTFTASDFGRTLVTNGDGTDHGWGGHHFVVGGAVRGGDLWGWFPEIGLGTRWDVGRGALLPHIGVDQYGATLGRWLGVPMAQLSTVFPNLNNFDTRDIGFMG